MWIKRVIETNAGATDAEARAAETRAIARRKRQRGAQAVEAALGLLIVLPFMFLIMDIGRGIFIKVSLQHAVREGVRYAITQQTSPSSTGQVASVKAVVATQAGGLIAGQENKVLVRFFSPDGVSELSGVSANKGGNVVMVSIVNFEYYPIIPVPKLAGGSFETMEIRGSPPVVMTVHAADRLEACATTGCPTI